MAARAREVVESSSSSDDSDSEEEEEEDEDDDEEEEEELVTTTVDNVFAVPWKKSDIILIIDGTELNVHRSTLIMQSPVFEAMLDGHFLEAGQNKVTLEGKTVEDMVQFLELLYPGNMFNPTSLLTNENKLVRMLELADEFQAEAVINQCLKAADITPKTALTILPFACKYNEAIRSKCVAVSQRSVPSKTLKRGLNFAKHDKDVVHEIFTGKTDLLEKVVQRSALFLLKSMRYFAANAGHRNSALNRCCFGHEVNVLSFNHARNCKACMTTYKENFCDGFTKKLVKSDGSKLVKLLTDMDDVLGQISPLDGKLKLS